MADSYDAILAAQDWDAITKRLVLFANRRLQKRSIETAKEVVQEALTRIWDPSYADWNPNTQPDLLRYLGSVVNGIVRNINVSVRERMIVAQEPRILERVAEHRTEGLDGRCADGGIDATKVIDCLLEQIEGDPLVSEIVLLMTDGKHKASEQANELGKPVAEIYKARSKLSGHVAIVKNKFPEVTNGS